jgi:hypothetical protein
MGIEFAGHRPSWAVAIIASTAQYGPDGVAREPVARAIADALPLFVQDVHFHLTCRRGFGQTETVSSRA